MGYNMKEPQNHYTEQQKPTQNSTGYDSMYRALEWARTIYDGKYPETASLGFGWGVGIGGSRQEGTFYGAGKVLYLSKGLDRVTVHICQSSWNN